MLLLVMCLLLHLEMGSGGGWWCGTMDDEMREEMSRERESTCARCIGGILSCCIACGCLFLSFDIYHGDDSLLFLPLHLFSLLLLNNMQPVSILER